MAASRTSGSSEQYKGSLILTEATESENLRITKAGIERYVSLLVYIWDILVVQVDYFSNELIETPKSYLSDVAGAECDKW